MRWYKYMAYNSDIQSYLGVLHDFKTLSYIFAIVILCEYSQRLADMQ